METKTCLNDALIALEQNTLIIQREKGFLSVGTSRLGGRPEMVRSLITHSLKSPEDSFPSSLKEGEKAINNLLKSNKVLEPAAVTFGNYNMENSVNITFDRVTALITADNSANLPVNITVIVNEELDELTLLNLFKATIEAKTAALWDLGMINSFSLDLFDSGHEDSILVACIGHGDLKTGVEVDKLRILVAKCVREATGKLMRNFGYPKDILGYMENVGVTVEDLVEAGMELCVGVDKTPVINDKLHKQLLKSLDDLNVVSLIMAGIRLEEDYAKHRVRGIDVDDDPAYLYSDEVLGMAVANQIAGTKAIFNFKRYDEEKPGIIGVLGPVLDDIFAGLVAGCMSKIFEE